MMRFIEIPWALALVAVLPLLAVLILKLERRSRAARLAKLGTRSMLTRLAPLGARLGAGRTVRMTLALLFMGFAFAGPRWGLGGQVAHSTGVDVALAMDASLSMMAQDAKPSRLEAMKNVVRQLRAQSPNDRFAMLAFAGHSYVLSPLTSDQGALDLYLNNLDPSTVGVAGSSISDALKQATTLLSMRHGDASRVIVLMSDGETFEPMGDVTTAAKQAGEAGITLITVGFGTPQGTTIPVKNAKGQVTKKLDGHGNVVVTKYSPLSLRQAAQASAHGVFIPAEATNKVEQIRKAIGRITPEARATESGVDLAPKFQWFVLVSFLLLLIDTLIVLKPRRRRIVAAATAAATVMAAAACERPAAPHAQAALPPDTASIALYNRGTMLLKHDSLAVALPKLDSALDSRDSTVKFRSVFNGGWDHMMSSVKMYTALKKGGATADSVLKAVQRDTALRRAEGDPTLDSATSGSAAEDSAGADGMDNGMGSGTGAPRQPAGQLSKQDLLALATAYMSDHVDSSVVKFRNALLAHPNDPDAKWNYELALQYASMFKGKDGKNGKKNSKKNKKNSKKNSKNSKQKQKPKPSQKKQQQKKQQKQPMKKPGKKKGQPPIEQLRLPPQQAEQLLNAMGQHEQNAAKAVPVPATPPPQGKDW